MKSRILYSGLMLLIVAGLASCQNNVFTDPPPQFSSQYFPNKVGDSWTYSVTDTAFNHRWLQKFTTGTLQVSVVQSSGSITSWKTIWPESMHPVGSRIESQYVKTVGDTAVSSNIGEVYGPFNLLYKFPLKVGKNWQTGGPTISRVVSIDSLSVPAGSFGGVYRIYTYAVAPQSSFKQNIWFKPGVGVIQVTHLGSGYYNAYTLKLIKYHVK